MNSVQLVGRLVRDPEMRFVPQSGVAVTTLTIAVDKKLNAEQRKKAQENGTPTADFPRIIAFGKIAETVANFFAKGDMIGVEGRIQTSTFKKQDGSTGFSTDVVLEQLTFLPKAQSSKPDSVPNDDFQAIEDDSEIPF